MSYKGESPLLEDGIPMGGGKEKSLGKGEYSAYDFELVSVGLTGGLEYIQNLQNSFMNSNLIPNVRHYGMIPLDYDVVIMSDGRMTSMQFTLMKEDESFKGQLGGTESSSRGDPATSEFSNHEISASALPEALSPEC